MYDTEFLAEDVNAANIDIDSLITGLSEFREIRPNIEDLNGLESGATEFLEAGEARFELLLSRLRDSISALQQDPSTDAAYSVLIINNELDAQLGAMRSYLLGLHGRARQINVPGVKTVKSSIRKAARYIKKYLMPFLKSLSAKLWNIVSSMLKPKEWKISGSVSTGVLGLANVGLEITFEPPSMSGRP